MAKRAITTGKVPVTPEGLEMVCKEIWGEKWRQAFSDATGISYSQLHRYMTFYKGQVIPKIVILALVAIRDLADAKRPFPDVTPFEDDIANVKPVKFVQQAKPKPERVDNDAPLTDWGDFGDDTPTEGVETDHMGDAEFAEFAAQAETAPEPETAPIEPPKAETKPVKKPAKPKAAAKAKAPAKPAAKPAKKPAKADPAAATAKAKPRRTMAKA